MSSSNETTEGQASTPVPIISPSSLTKPKDGETFVLLPNRRLSSESSPPGTQQDAAGGMVWSMARQSTAKPGRAQRLKSEPSADESEPLSPRNIEDRLKTQKDDNKKQVKELQKSLSIEESQQLDEECLQRFIKVNVRLMTDDHVSKRFQKEVSKSFLIIQKNL